MDAYKILVAIVLFGILIVLTLLDYRIDRLERIVEIDARIEHTKTMLNGLMEEER